MKLYFRFIAALLRAVAGRPRLGIADESVLSFRVWPTDLDFNLHLNNARYLSFMDIGRLDLLAGFRMLGPLVQFRWSPVVGAVMLKFRRGLDPWMRFTLHTRLVGWDDKWFYLEQRFERGGELHAHGLVRALFRSSAGSLTPAVVLETLGRSAESPPLTEQCERWRAALDAGRAPASEILRRLA